MFSEAHPTKLAVKTTSPLHVVASTLSQLNSDFLDTHHSAAASALQTIQTVMVLKRGVLSLWRNSGKEFMQVESLEVAPMEYHSLKAICHIPLILLNKLKAGAINADILRGVKNKLQNSLAEIIIAKPDLPCRENVISILKASIYCAERLAFLSAWRLEDKAVQEILALYKISIAKDLERLTAEATRKQLSSLHKITQEWIKIREINLSANRVLLVAPHGPRRGYIEMQYFTALYKRKLSLFSEPVKDNYVYYVEMLNSQMGDVDIKARLIEEFLAREEHNKTAAGWLLDNPLGMQQDVLKDEAPAIIEELWETSDMIFKSAAYR